MESPGIEVCAVAMKAYVFRLSLAFCKGVKLGSAVNDVPLFTIFIVLETSSTWPNSSAVMLATQS